MRCAICGREFSREYWEEEDFLEEFVAEVIYDREEICSRCALGLEPDEEDDLFPEFWEQRTWG
jgi:DNA-directed RNA polymerase subunit RPC12/RpoP